MESSRDPGLVALIRVQRKRAQKETDPETIEWLTQNAQNLESLLGEDKQMETQFKVGDVVELKSGSPAMTVTSIGTEQAVRGHLFVSWFVDGTEKKTYFPPGALLKREPEEGA